MLRLKRPLLNNPRPRPDYLSRAYPYEIPGEKQRRKKTQDTDMTTRKEILETLSRLNSELAKDYKVQRIGLFGSYARSEQRPESDIDLLVAFADGADLFDLARLKYFLEERLGHRVDIVPERALRNELKKSVLADVKYA